MLTLWAACDNTQLTYRYLLDARHHATCSLQELLLLDLFFQMGRQTEAQRTGVTSKGT